MYGVNVEVQRYVVTGDVCVTGSHDRWRKRLNVDEAQIQSVVSCVGKDRFQSDCCTKRIGEREISRRNPPVGPDVRREFDIWIEC